MGGYENDKEYIEQVFTYHRPTEAQIPRYEAIRNAAKAFAEVLMQNCPTSADKSHAIRLIRTAVMFANASIALDGNA